MQAAPSRSTAAGTPVQSIELLAVILVVIPSASIGPDETDQLDDTSNLSCDSATWLYLVDGCEPTHNRSVAIPALPKLLPRRGDSLHLTT